MENEKPIDLDFLLEQLTALKDSPFVAADYVDFRAGLLDTQAQVLAGLGNLPLGDSFPLDGASIPLDGELVASVAGWFRLVAGEDQKQSDEFEALYQWGQQGGDRFADLARKAAFGPDLQGLTDLGDEIKVAPTTLLFVGRAMAAPFVHALVTRQKEAGVVLAEESGSGLCPACGSAPALALLVGEEGKRMLCCSLCGEKWRFTRLACPECNNTDQETLTTLRINDTDPSWLENCDKCKSYLKTFDAREVPADQTPIALVHEIASLHLDLLAEKNDYTPKLPYASLI